MQRSNRKKLGDLAEIKHGFAFPGKHIVSQETDRILMTPGHFALGGGFRHNHKKYFDSSDYRDGYELEAGDLVVTMTDLSKTGDTLGYGAVVPQIKDKILLHNQRIGKVVLKSAELDQSFCHYLLRSSRYRQYVLETCTGSTVKHTSPTKILDYEFDLPSINDQKAIAQILGTLDEKIELNQQMNQTLEEIAKAIFKSWFVDFDPVRAKADGRPTGLPSEISDLFPDELVDSEIGEIPKGWSQESIYQFCSVEYGAPFKSKHFNEDGQGIPLVRIRDLPKGKSWVFTEEIHPKGTLIKAGDLVVGMDGEFRCHLWRGTDSWMNQRVCKFVPKENVPSTFIWFALERPLHFIESTEVATTVIHLGKGDIDDFQFMRSSQELLDKFSKITSPLLERMVIASKEIEILAELRDTLLPKLISGELRIPDAEKFLEEAGI